jgi:hypothetical protein
MPGQGASGLWACASGRLTPAVFCSMKCEQGVEGTVLCRQGSWERCYGPRCLPMLDRGMSWLNRSFSFSSMVYLIAYMNSGGYGLQGVTTSRDISSKRSNKCIRAVPCQQLRLPRAKSWREMQIRVLGQLHFPMSKSIRWRQHVTVYKTWDSVSATMSVRRLHIRLTCVVIGESLTNQSTRPRPGIRTPSTIKKDQNPFLKATTVTSSFSGRALRPKQEHHRSAREQELHRRWPPSPRSSNVARSVHASRSRRLGWVAARSSGRDLGRRSWREVGERAHGGDASRRPGRGKRGHGSSYSHPLQPNVVVKTLPAIAALLSVRGSQGVSCQDRALHQRVLAEPQVIGKKLQWGAGVI